MSTLADLVPDNTLILGFGGAESAERFFADIHQLDVQDAYVVQEAVEVVHSRDGHYAAHRIPTRLDEMRAGILGGTTDLTRPSNVFGMVLGQMVKPPLATSITQEIEQAVAVLMPLDSSVAILRGSIKESVRVCDALAAWRGARLVCHSLPADAHALVGIFAQG